MSCDTAELAEPDTAETENELRSSPGNGLDAAAIAAGLMTTACGGGSSGDGGGGDGASLDASSTGTVAAGGGIAAVNITPQQASRFLAQASMGATREQIARVQAVGYSAWLEEQFAMTPSVSRWDWLVGKGYNDIANKNSENGFDACSWRKLLSSPDTLRQRITLALSELLVVSIDSLGGGWRAFAGAAWLDLLEANAFGNYRTLLQQVSTSTAMGTYLTFRGNVKYNPATGAMPDENYARELMQLFTIGLVELSGDGTPKLQDGKPAETYSLDDITGLARIFTGWDFDRATGDTAPDFHRKPMIQVAKRHETGASSFLGSTVPAGLDGQAALTAALDIIFAHRNVAPFVSKQLIQRLVTSNPSPAYVARVAAVFNNDGAGVKGNLKAVIRAILLDEEARSDSGITAPSFGKLREPVLRFSAWARAFKASSPNDRWDVGNTSDNVGRLGQSPLRAPSVFNFFRPGYTPPNTAFSAAAMVAPEFQIANESTVVGYVNFMQRVVKSGIGEVKADYATLMPMADTAETLIKELNLVLAAGQLSTPTVDLLKSAIDSMPKGTDTARLNRIYAAITLVMASPEFIAQK